MNPLISATCLGGPTVILEAGGLRIMTDPTLDPAGTAFSVNDKLAYSKTRGPAQADPGPIDLVLLSHDQHGDNLDHAGRSLLEKVPLTLTTRAGAQRLQGRTRGLAPWESVTLDTPDGNPVLITATPARHGPAGVEKLTGEVIGFVVAYGDRAFYFTGDTVFYEGVRQVADRFKPEYVFIFAGAAQARGPFNLTMSANDALDTAAAFPDAFIVPVHAEGWTHYTETTETLRQSFAALGIADRLRILIPGSKTIL